MRDRLRAVPWILILFSLGYGIVMLSMNGPLRHLEGVSPYHRLQAQALLNGHLSVGDSIREMNFGLAWHNGHVQQVWGLGVGIWLAPFQAIWRMFGGKVFPDRIALGLAMALLAFYSGSTGLRIAKRGNISVGIALVWLVLLCPPLLTLNHVAQLVFEETVLYGILMSFGILVACIRVLCFNSKTDFYLCCVMSGYAGFVRPTCAIYGLIGITLCSIVMFSRGCAGKHVLTGILIFGSGIMLLGFTNEVRFGSPTEFGHRLTATSGDMVYLTRFGNPYDKTRTVEAVKELGGMMFLNSNVKNASAFSEDLFTGQSPVIRWRKLSFSTFDPSYLLLIFIAFLGTGIWIVRGQRACGENAQAQCPWPCDRLIPGLFVWGAGTLFGLTLFYLYFPVMTSRYILDFLPAIVGLVFLSFVFLGNILPRLSTLLLAVWLLYGLLTARFPANAFQSTQDASAEMGAAEQKKSSLNEFTGFYTPSNPASTGIPCNGYGWDSDGGFAQDIVILAIDKPKFVELHLEGRRKFNGIPARPDVYRAQIDGIELPCRATAKEGDELKVIFDIPHAIQARQNDELLFICFSSEYESEDRGSERVIHSIRWR